MPRKGGERRFDLLLHPDDAREAALIAWIDQQRGNYDSLRLFMIEVLEWAMTGDKPTPSQQASMPVVNVSIDQNAFVPIADAVGRSVGEAVRAAYTDVQRMTALEPPKANAQWRTDD